MDATSTLLLELLVGYVLLRYIGDGAFFWYLVHQLLTRSPTTVPVPGPVPVPTPQPAPTPIPGPVAPSPTSAPLPSPTKPSPRFTGITATSFAGGNDSVSSRTSAYDGKIINGDTELAAALPYHFPGQPPVIRVFYQGRTVNAPIRDVGPWNTKDPYWNSNSRPQAETGTDTTGRKTNLAGLDLSPASWKALGYAGDARNAKDKVDWDFVDALDGTTSTSPSDAAPASTQPTGVPAHLSMMRSLIGTDARTHGPAIVGWAHAIGVKFPQMASYCAGYTDATIAWCGLTCGYVFAMNGTAPPFGTTDVEQFLYAASWLQFGSAVETPQPGDVLVFQWAGGGHHVTLYDHEEDDNYYHCTGGNQGSGHVVSTEAMPMKNCIGIRRPPVA